MSGFEPEKEVSYWAMNCWNLLGVALRKFDTWPDLLWKSSKSFDKDV